MGLVGFMVLAFSFSGSLTAGLRVTVELVAIAIFVVGMAFGFVMVWRYRPGRGSMPPRQ
jgi:hypothetical protein